jgi:hypothetical protein
MCATAGDAAFWENEDEDGEEEGEGEGDEEKALFDKKKERQLSFESKLYGYQMEKEKEKAQKELQQSMQGGKRTALEDFELLKVLGKGSFGKVSPPCTRITNTTHALNIPGICADASTSTACRCCWCKGWTTGTSTPSRS